MIRKKVGAVRYSVDFLYESKLAPLTPQIWGELEEGFPQNWGTGEGDRVFMQEV
jgi:hypothetical protein